MKTPAEVTAILEPQRQGWSVKRITRELGVGRGPAAKDVQ